jgi:hypothetical protein
VSVGDLCLFYDNPRSPQNPALAFVSERPGANTLSLLVFSASLGWHDRKSVRHADDPFWRESEMAQNWQQWGCWRAHPITELMPVLSAMVSDWKIARAKRQTAENKKGTE